MDTGEYTNVPSLKTVQSTVYRLFVLPSVYPGSTSSHTEGGKMVGFEGIAAVDDWSR
jgi:hypothetical protein